MLERGETAAQDTLSAPELAPSLPAEINGATRNLHTNLNRLITSRLPLALPPNTTDPTLYATGLLHFAHIFLTFESLWADLVRDHTHNQPDLPSPPTSPLLSYLLVNPYDSPALFTSTLGAPTPVSPELAAFLQSLRPRGLLRSARLKRDLEHLLALHPTDLEVVLAKYPGDKVAEFCTHIRKTVHTKPWTLLSYAWCFYMAVFSGGRWIRAGLLNAGSEFWGIDATAEKVDVGKRLAEGGLSFWHFPGQFDGEDIKLEFKNRLAAAERLLSVDQRVDIIEEAKMIFEFSAALVDELDGMLGSKEAEQQLNPPDKREALSSKTSVSAPVLVKSRPALAHFIRRPEVTGTLVALGCLACVALLKLQ